MPPSRTSSGLHNRRWLCNYRRDLGQNWGDSSSTNCRRNPGPEWQLHVNLLCSAHAGLELLTHWQIHLIWLLLDASEASVTAPAILLFAFTTPEFPSFVFLTNDSGKGKGQGNQILSIKIQGCLKWAICEVNLLVTSDPDPASLIPKQATKSLARVDTRNWVFKSSKPNLQQYNKTDMIVKAFESKLYL